MTESDLLAAALDVLRVYGWRTLHIRPGLDRRGHWATPLQGDGVGWPDVVAVRGSELVAIECKSATGKLTPSQSEWLGALRQAGVRCLLLRPAGLQSLPGWLNKREAA